MSKKYLNHSMTSMPKPQGQKSYSIIGYTI